MDQKLTILRSQFTAMVSALLIQLPEYLRIFAKPSVNDFKRRSFYNLAHELVLSASVFMGLG